MITQKNYQSNKEPEKKEAENEKEPNKEETINNQTVATKIPHKHKRCNESKSQKTFIIKKKKTMKRKTEKIKNDDFREHFQEIINEIEKEENEKFNEHQSDGFEEGRSDSESSSDDLEVIHFYKFCQF